MTTNVERANARHVEQLKKAQERDDEAQRVALAAVAESAAVLLAAQAALTDHIKDARKVGCSLREIARSAGMNHETIRRQAR